MINPNDAPEGYVAIESFGCKECAFFEEDIFCRTAKCCPAARSDNSFVIFIKKE